jgi:hypothetical protein
MTLVQDGFVCKNGTLETGFGYLSFAEIALTFSDKSISISSPTPNKPLKDIQFRLKEGATPPKISASSGERR